MRKEPTQHTNTNCYGTTQRSGLHQCFIAFLACAVILFSVEPVYASSVGDVLCRLYGAMYSDIGRGIATLAVAVLGVGATLGKTSWGLAMTVAVGIAAIFNASGIVGQTAFGGSGCAILALFT